MVPTMLSGAEKILTHATYGAGQSQEWNQVISKDNVRWYLEGSLVWRFPRGTDVFLA